MRTIYIFSWLTALVVPVFSSQIVVERSIGIQPDRLRIDGPACDKTFACSAYNAHSTDKACHCVCPGNSNSFSTAQSGCINAVNSCSGISIQAANGPNVFGFLWRESSSLTLPYSAQLDVTLITPISECTGEVLIDDDVGWSNKSSQQTRLIRNEDGTASIQLWTNMTMEEPIALDGDLVQLRYSCGNTLLCILIKFEGIVTMELSDPSSASSPIPSNSMPLKPDAIYIITGTCIGILLITSIAGFIVYKCVNSRNKDKSELKVERMDNNGNIMESKQPSNYSRVQVDPNGKMNRYQASKKIQGRFIKNVASTSRDAATGQPASQQPQTSRFSQSLDEMNSSQRDSSSSTSNNQGMFAVNSDTMMKHQSHTSRGALRSKSFANGVKPPVHKFQRSKSLNECNKREKQGIDRVVKQARSHLTEFEGIRVKAEKEKLAANPSALFNSNRQRIGNYSGIIGQYQQPITLKGMSETSGSQLSLEMDHFEKNSSQPKIRTAASTVTALVETSQSQASSSIEWEPIVKKGDPDGSVRLHSSLRESHSIPRGSITEDFYFAQPFDTKEPYNIADGAEEQHAIESPAPSDHSSIYSRTASPTLNTNPNIPDKVETESHSDDSVIVDMACLSNDLPAIKTEAEDCPVTNIDDLMDIEDSEEIMMSDANLPKVDTVIVDISYL